MTGQQLHEIARMVRRVFAKHQRRVGLGAAGDDTVSDLDDVQQVAAAAIWEHYLRKRLPLDGRRTLYYDVGARAAGKYLKRIRSPQHLTDHAIDKLGMTGDVSEGRRVEIVGCGWSDEFEDGTPSEIANPAGSMRASWLVERREVLRRRAELLAAMDAAARGALGRRRSGVGRRLQGLSPRAVTQAIDEAARQLGRNRETVRKIGTRYRQAVRRDPSVRAARRAMVDCMETTS